MTSATSVPEPAALARAFLALGDGAPVGEPRRAPAAAVVLLTAIVVAMSSPLIWAGLVSDPHDAAAALAPSRVALVDADDDAPGAP